MLADRKSCELTDEEIIAAYKRDLANPHRAIATAATRKALQTAATICHERELAAMRAREWDAVLSLQACAKAIREGMPDA